MALIPQRFIDDLLDRVDIVDVVGSRVDLRKSGKNYSARCPFHNEKTPSFTVSPDKQFYYCFGCQATGNAVGFLMDNDRLSFPEAVETLARQAGMEVPREASQESRGDGRRKQLYDVLAEADRFFREQLRRHPDARLAVDYLKGRGLSGEIAARFGIGYAPQGWDHLLNRLGGDDERVRLLIEAGLVIRKDDDSTRVYDRFRNRIQFPIRDTRGRTLGFGGRVLDDSKPKYLNSPETPVFHKGRELYGLYEANKVLREIPRLVVVEGYMDVVALAQHGIHNAVATLGTAATTEHLDKLFRYTPEVVFCFDGDEAGRRAARRAMETSLQAMRDGRSARFLFLPEGEDPDTLVRKQGPEGFRELLDGAQPLSQFLFTTLEEGLDTTIPEGKARLRELGAPLINRIGDGVYRQLMLRELARRTDVDEEVLAGMVAPTDPAPDSAPPAGDWQEPPLDAYDDYLEAGEFDPDLVPSGGRQAVPARRLRLTPVQRLILLLLHHPHLCGELDSLGDPAALDDPDAETLAQLQQLLRERPDYTLNHILGYWRGIHGADRGETLARLVASDMMRGAAGGNRDDLREFRDICAHLQAELERQRPPLEQLEELLALENPGPAQRQHVLRLWHRELAPEQRTETLNTRVKQLLAKRVQ